MYKIVGADGREYGPVSAEQLTDWIRQGRVSARSLIQFNDGPWQPLSSYSEFAAVIAETAGAASVTPPSPNVPPGDVVVSVGPSSGGNPTQEPQLSSPGYGQSSPPPPTQYWMRGADGREYGPASFEQMRAWILENRAGAQTLARRDGSTDWLPLSTMPEFASLFPSFSAGGVGGGGGPKPEITPDAGVPAMESHLLSEHIRGRDYRVRIGESFSRSWALFKEHLGLILAAQILLLIVVMIGYVLTGFLTGSTTGRPPAGGVATAQHITLTIVGSVLQTVINALAIGGYYAFLMNLMRGHRVAVTNVFVGFSRLAGPLIVLEVVRSILTVLGFVLCVLPGIYLAVAWIFAVPVLLDKKYSFWESMEVSRKVVTQHWFQVFVFLILVFLFNVLGAVACLVGLLVTFPVSTLAFLYLYEDIFDIDKPVY
ncbi:MAG TPA: GYF domain-containing protein [Methylomirabilota bacterium]|nr:GYF domain-containing protein [Methylomirabilota bacterium]